MFQFGIIVFIIIINISLELEFIIGVTPHYFDLNQGFSAKFWYPGKIKVRILKFTIGFPPPSIYPGHFSEELMSTLNLNRYTFKLLIITPKYSYFESGSLYDFPSAHAQLHAY